MIIKRVKKTNTYDVFLGIGWENHTRVINNKGKISYVSGNKLPPIKFVEISKTIESVIRGKV